MFAVASGSNATDSRTWSALLTRTSGSDAVISVNYASTKGGGGHGAGGMVVATILNAKAGDQVSMTANGSGRYYYNGICVISIAE